MSLAFVDVDPVEIGAPVAGFLRAARDRFYRAAVGSSLQPVMSVEERRIRDAFDHMAELMGLSDDETHVLCGAGGSLSRVILALEFLGVALDLFEAPDAVATWLREGDRDDNGCAPLDVMVGEGRLGVELLLLRLRTRLRAAQLYAEQAGCDRIGGLAVWMRA